MFIYVAMVDEIHNVLKHLKKEFKARESSVFAVIRNGKHYGKRGNEM